MSNKSAGPVAAELIGDLAAASRILAAHGVVDGFGHVSLRHPGAPDRYLMARSLAPALVTPHAWPNPALNDDNVRSPPMATGTPRSVASPGTGPASSSGCVFPQQYGAPDVVSAQANDQPALTLANFCSVDTGTGARLLPRVPLPSSP